MGLPMSKVQGLDDIRFDVRLVDRFLDSGILSQEEYQKFLESLPDCSDNIAPPEDEKSQDKKAQAPSKG